MRLVKRILRYEMTLGGDSDLEGDRVPLEMTTRGTIIRTAREACGLSQQEVADAMRVTAQAVSFWENDKTSPSQKRMRALADLLGIPVSDLLDGDSPKPDTSVAAEPNLVFPVNRSLARGGIC